MYNSRIKNVEIPENLFSNLGGVKPKRHEIKESPKFIKQYEKDNNVKLTNYSKHTEYRDRITKMYEDLKDIKPIDNEMDNVLYFNNYIEKGIVVKPKVASLKQFWTEFRLINNEKTNQKESYKMEHKELDNFEQLFDALSIRVSEINKYIDELREMKTSIDATSNQLREDQEHLKAERKEFQKNKNAEETKIKEEKETLKINFDRLQTIIDDLDKKLGSIDKVEN